MEFTRQESWNGYPFLSPEDLPGAGVEPGSPAWWKILYHLSHIDYQFSSVQLLSRVRLFVTPWTIACQASLSMEFTRQDYWSGLPLPFPGDPPDPGIEPTHSALHAIFTF